ncbi:hypothetical protein AAFF_G00389140 [Aldrovandia affinis]|uniref:Ankyrin repeat domain-containing protein 39 n=1 Tax=Aldrovandia affinis TaxID=143900 RepID=A0AAD7SES7_9TELE|nr:hypothetical protein AAFF_G00389140 [Aldrovandia affinis]
MESGGHQCTCCAHNLATPSAHQTLEEMDFDRGIWSAAVDGDLERVRSFLRKGTDPNARDRSGYTSLHYASRGGNESMCALLLDGGACASPQTRGGATPLHRSAYCGHLGVVRLLLDRGADPMLCDDDGSSPLHKAAQQGHEEVCELLLQRSPALSTLTDRRSRAPYQLVQESGPLQELLRPAPSPSSMTRARHTPPHHCTGPWHHHGGAQMTLHSHDAQSGGDLEPNTVCSGLKDLDRASETGCLLGWQADQLSYRRAPPRPTPGAASPSAPLPVSVTELTSLLAVVGPAVCRGDALFTARLGRSGLPGHRVSLSGKRSICVTQTVPVAMVFCHRFSDDGAGH